MSRRRTRDEAFAESSQRGRPFGFRRITQGDLTQAWQAGRQAYRFYQQAPPLVQQGLETAATAAFGYFAPSASAPSSRSYARYSGPRRGPPRGFYSRREKIYRRPYRAVTNSRTVSKDCTRVFTSAVGVVSCP